MATFFDDFASALNSYPVDDVVVSITDASVHVGTAGSVNVNEVWKFKVNVTNNGHVNMTNVTLHVTGRNDAIASATGVAPFVAGTIVTTPAMTVNAGGSQKTGFVYFRAPAGVKGAGTELVDAHINTWDADLAGLLVSQSGHASVPEGSYANQVFP